MQTPDRKPRPSTGSIRAKRLQRRGAFLALRNQEKGYKYHAEKFEEMAKSLMSDPPHMVDLVAIEQCLAMAQNYRDQEQRARVLWERMKE